MNIDVKKTVIENFEMTVGGRNIKFEMYFILSNFFNVINTIKPTNNSTIKEKNKYDKKILKNEKMMVVIQNLQIDGLFIDELKLIEEFKKLQNIPEFSKFIQTKNQHYLKKNIQKKWKNKASYVFNAHAGKAQSESTGQFLTPPIYKNLSYRETILINVNKDLVVSDFKEDDIGADNNSYTLFMKDSIIFIEGLLVNRIEDFMENLPHKSAFDNVDKNMVLFLMKSNFINRIFLIQKIAYTIYENKINDFYQALKNDTDIKIIYVKLDRDVFNLHINWAVPFYPAFFLGLDCNIIPLTPSEAIIVSMNVDEKNCDDKLKNILENMDSSYFDINSYSFEIYNLFLQKTKVNTSENFNIAETTWVNSGEMLLYRKHNLIRANHLNLITNIVTEDINSLIGNNLKFNNSIHQLLDAGDINAAFLRSINLIQEKIYKDYKEDYFMMDLYFKQLLFHFNKFYTTNF